MNGRGNQDLFLKSWLKISLLDKKFHSISDFLVCRSLLATLATNPEQIHSKHDVWYGDTVIQCAYDPFQKFKESKILELLALF